MNKNVALIPISILMCVVMFASLTAPAFAQTTNTNQPTQTRNPGYMSSVYSYYNVASQNNILGQQDGYYATFYSGGMLVGQMNTNIAASSYVCVYAAGSGTLTIYVGNSGTGSWTWSGSIPISGPGWYNVRVPVGFRYVGLSTDGTIGIDCCITT